MSQDDAMGSIRCSCSAYGDAITDEASVRPESQRGQTETRTRRAKAEPLAACLQSGQEQAQLKKNSNASLKVNGIAQSPDVQRLQVPNKKCCTINTDVTCIDQGDTGALVEFSNMSDEDNSSFPDIDYTATPLPSVTKFQSLRKMSTCASLDSMIRNVDIISPRTMQRNLAELEFDWLAAVIERIFLIFFIIVFLLTAVGINCIGLYYWCTAQDFST